ncbi:cytochrome-c peroxidase [Rappaport israeli]|uniref:cytochrome-c peroxidase n=1 Tax=Rappaport israeli TaxID=1839807 RepID=UPI000ADAC889|nr:cytochrome c peroxidase [Rappaport israeli]
MHNPLSFSTKFAWLFCMMSLTSQAEPLTQEQIGQLLFFDPTFSNNRGQSCSSCHDPASAFVDTRKTSANGQVSLGDDGHSFGNRNAPTISYAAAIPEFHYDPLLKEYVGGLFWDGRARTLADQAAGPPLNPLEMGMSDKRAIVLRLKENSSYHSLLPPKYQQNLHLEISDSDIEQIYSNMTEAIATFERSAFFSSYDSKYDKFLRGEYELTPLEDLGRSLFFSEKNVNCSTCHSLYPEDDSRETFTNHQYRNIGVPSNRNLIAHNRLAKEYVDQGLLDNPEVKDKRYAGKFRNPTLRNVAITAPYMHNGVFKDLRTVIEFYDHYNNPERQINPETGQAWQPPEYAQTVDLNELKAQPLTERKIEALIAFLHLLTDERYEHLLSEKTP